MILETHENISEELHIKLTEWTHTQEELARQVRVPRTELCCLPPPFHFSSMPSTLCEHTGSFYGQRVGAVDVHFIHQDFVLPEALLTSLFGASSTTNPTRMFRGDYYRFAHAIFKEQIAMDIQRQRMWIAQLENLSQNNEGKALNDMVTPPPNATPRTPPWPLPPLRYVAGIDISFIPGALSYGVVCLSLHAYPSMELLANYTHHCELKEPYIHGFLAFREALPMMELLIQVREKLEKSDWHLQLLLVDGCGVHHPRRCGLASHLGVLLGIPTIGCAKKLLSVDGISRNDVEGYFASVATSLSEQKRNLPVAESTNHLVKGVTVNSVREVDHGWLPPLHPILGKSITSSSERQLYGYAVQIGSTPKRCIYVSPGTGVGYAMAVGLVLSMCQHRIPEPIRSADLMSRDYIRRMGLGVSATYDK